MSKVTVLVAVYNAEKYLRRCLDSLVGQTLRDIQIVCIDDCSTDSSLSVLREYSRRDSRVEVIALKENHGQAYARNQGIAVSTGEFITSVDADDWLAPDALEQVVKVFDEHPDTDSVLFDIKYIYPDGRQHDYNWSFPTDKFPPRSDGSFTVMTGYDAFVASLSWQIHGWSVDRAYLFHKFPYDDTCRFYSDDNSSHLHYLESREVRTSHAVYYYRQSPESTTRHIGVGRLDWMTAADSMRRKLTELGMPEEIMKLWEWERWKIIVGCYGFVYAHNHQFTADERAYCADKLKKAWAGTNVPRLNGRPIRKLGYCPMKGHWRLFCMQENLYFWLKKKLQHFTVG